MRQTLARLDVAEVADPLTELGRLAGQVLAWRDEIADRVNDLTRLRYEASGSGTEQLRAEVALFERALDRCMAVLVAMAKLDIDARLAAITEQQANTLMRAVDAAFAFAGISGTTAVEARRVMARELRAVPS